MSPQPAEVITPILRARCGQWTLVELYDGRKLRVFDIAWGRDMGVDFDHITTNVSPGPSEEHTVDFFHTSEVAAVTDLSNGETLFTTRTNNY